MRDEAEHDPFARLENTHRRIEERLLELEAAAPRLVDPAERAQALEIVHDVLGFFERAGARHHDDEELSLFPRLVGNAELVPVLRALEDEHRTHDAAYAALADGVRAGVDPATLGALVARLATIYRAHIAREEAELFPRARAALDPETAAAVAAEMSARRGGGRRRI
jgi:hemerythrin-like domain-containing protein